MAIIMRYAVMALHGVIRNPKGATRRGGGQPRVHLEVHQEVHLEVHQGENLKGEKGCEKV